MGEKKGESTKKQHLSTSPEDPVQESPETTVQQPPQTAVATVTPPFISAPLYVSSSTPFEKFEAVNPKRPRITSSTGQWKLLPSPTHQQKQTHMNIPSSESSPPPLPQTHPHSTAASSSETASPTSHSAASAQEAAATTTKPELTEQQFHHQLRKGKYVSPVWKPDEMLWLAKAWRTQYQGGSDVSGSGFAPTAEFVSHSEPPARGKTRAEKDREVAEFLQRHGVNRDAKTAGTKWDNMLGEFRKVYEWERGGERETVVGNKSYFRLSPYERKLHRLPASFDEEVFEELSQFMGSRMRMPQRGIHIVGGEESRQGFGSVKALPPPPPFREEEHPLSARSKQLVTVLGFETPPPHLPPPPTTAAALDVAGPSSSSSSSKEIRRVGKIRMVWEESVSLWAEESDHHHHHQIHSNQRGGRIKIQGLSFLNADELAFLDDTTVASAMEAFEDGPLKGFSVDRFFPGQQVKVFGRRKPPSPPPQPSGFSERVQLPFTESSVRYISPWEYQDPTDYCLGYLRVPPQTLPTLFELSSHLQEPPPEELRFPLRKDIYRDLPQEKDIFFTTSTDLLDSKSFTFEILSSILRPNPSLTGATATSRDSFIPLWDDCINRVVSKFCPLEMGFIRKPISSQPDNLQDQWPNLTGFIRNLCLWRGEETDQTREGQIGPSNLIVEKLLWTFMELPYVLGYYAVGYIVTFCALSRSPDRIIRTDLCTVDLSLPGDRLKALVPCWKIAGILPLLADRCFSNYKTQFVYSDFERIDLGNANFIELTPNLMTRFFSSKRKWTAAKEIYDFLDRRVPHAEFIVLSSERDLSVVFKPRGCRLKPWNCDQLVEALKHVTKALVALHDLSFMHRDLGWDKVMRRCDRESEWFVIGFEEAVGAPQIYPHPAASGKHAPEMGRGLHGVKVDVWGVGQLVKTCGLVSVPKMLRELQNRCLDHNAEQRPTAADCYHHLLQVQSSLSAASSTAVGGY